MLFRRRMYLIIATLSFSLSVLSPISAQQTPQPLPTAEPPLTHEDEAAIDYTELHPRRLKDGGFILGDPAAPLTIIVFVDWACPACQNYYPDLQRFVREQVAAGEAQFEVRMFPTAGGEMTVFAGMIAECMDEAQPGAFWQAYDAYFDLAARDEFFAEDGIRSVVTALDLDYGRMLTCGANADQVTTDVNYGRALGVTGTPAVMARLGDQDPEWIRVGNHVYDSGYVPYEILSALVDFILLPPNV
ncbi:MAG: thioredoxin domain-containing protein [Anaerolineae bacterium]